jgi:hypothetical protein
LPTTCPDLSDIGGYSRPDPIVQGGFDFLRGADYETLAARYELFRNPRTQQIYAYAQDRPQTVIDLLGLYGTTDCSYYDDVCRTDPNCRTYYCGGAQKVCRLGILRGKRANCIRQCLQEFDQEYNCNGIDCPVPFGVSAGPQGFATANVPYCVECITVAHAYCFASCGRNPDVDPVP